MMIRWMPIIAAVATLLVGVDAAASKPIRWRFDGCVVDGLLISVRGHRMTPMRTSRQGAPFDAKRYEGKRLTVSGHLLPGDYFVVDAATAKLVGACDLLKEKRFRSGLAWAHRSVARALLSSGKLAAAMVQIQRAVTLLPTVYAFYLVRAQIEARAGHPKKAAADIERCLARAKDDTERNWCRKALSK
ncbi:MAG: hypothetical protein KC609_11595 [Myxococcales bacterium]|nr:hypothetical protein [Myxococcales bacterium]